MESSLQNKNAPLSVPLWPFILFFAVWIDKIYFCVAKVPLMNAMGYPPTAVIGSVILQDLGVLALLFSLSLFSSGAMRLISVPLIVLLNLLYLGDSQVFQELHHRLTYLSIYRYIDELSAIASFFTWRKMTVAAGVVCALVYVRRIRLSLRRGKSVVFFALFVAGVAPLINWSGRPFDWYFENATANVLLVNKRVVLDRNFGEEVDRKARKMFTGLSERFDRLAGLPPTEAPAGVHGPSALNDNTRPNVILVVSESLSQVDSLRSGGIFNNLPRIDKLQSDGLTLTNVISDGSTTSDALAALLMGMGPLPTSQLSEEMSTRFPLLDGHGVPLRDRGAGAGACGSNIVCRAREAGYKTIFLTNGPLGFLGHGDWFKALGFDRIEGGDSPFYAGASRFAFNSPSDEMLYRRAGEVIRGQSGPFFLVMLTVSLHLPSALPDPGDKTGSDPLVNVLTYIDRTTSEFYRSLMEAGVMRNSILLLLGDHRRMTPLDPVEFERKGIDSQGRVVACFLGAGVRKGGFDDTLLNQSDLSLILRSLLHGDPVFDKGLAAYNKGNLLGLGGTFAVQLVSDDYGRVLVRRAGQRPWLVTMRQDMDPMSLRKDAVDRQIITYLLLSAARLEARQREAEGGASPYAR